MYRVCIVPIQPWNWLCYLFYCECEEPCIWHFKK